MVTISTTLAFGEQILVDEMGNISINGNLGPQGTVQFDSTLALSVLTYSLPFAGNSTCDAEGRSPASVIVLF